VKKPEKLQLGYCGYKKPSNLKESNFEILGLKNLIKQAEERISMLEQSSYLAEITMRDESGEIFKEIFKYEEQ
jgi:hypothetical protein